MIYYSNKTLNFREFIENTSAGAFTSDRLDAAAPYTGRLHPQITLDFPTVTRRGEVICVKVKGANYCIQVNGGVTILIPRKIYHLKYNRLPRSRTVKHPGDMVTAVFYKYKEADKENYQLKGFEIDNLR